MLSNKLTFSLVFVLMLAVALVFVATPAMAQIDIAGITADTKFAVVVPDSPAGGIADPDAATANELVITAAANVFPDLESLLYFGGTIELQMGVPVASPGSPTDAEKKVATDLAAAYTAAFAPGADDDAKKATAWHDFVISEVMWGLDGDGTAAQWIEIYNNSAAALPTGHTLRLVFFDDRMTDGPEVVRITGGADPTATGFDDPAWVLVDRVSTVNRFGSQWDLVGSSGKTAAPAPTEASPVPQSALVSMYRKRDLTPAGDAYKDTGDGMFWNDGTDGDSWVETPARARVNLTGRYFVGTPFSPHLAAPGGVKETGKGPGSLSATGIIINEIRNDTSEANLDWIELYHNNDADDAIPVNIKDYQLSVVTAAEKETVLASLPSYKLKPNEYLVIYNRDPSETKLAGGVSVVDVAAGDQVNRGASHLYAVSSDLDIPNTGEQLIVLRTKATNADNHADGVIDVVGNGFYAVNKVVGKTSFNTDAYPLNGWSGLVAAGAKDNTFASSTQSWGRETVLDDNGNYRPKSVADAKRGEGWIAFDAVGGLGYDRDVDLATSPGTPGYANKDINVISDDRDNEAKKVAYKFAGMISISEVMYDARHPRDLVQWIELYNNSPDTVINLQGWRMEIRNIADGKVESYVDSGFTFGGEDEDDVLILPNQTLLLVSRTGPSSVPRTRVYDLNQEHRTDLGLQRRDKVLLSSEGFYLELKAKINEGGAEKMMMVDSAGNLMVDGATRTKQWDLPPADDEGARTSIVRQYDAGAAADGSMEDSWKVSDFAGLAYYGHRDDTGTPGYRRGGPLPVSLSSFRPVRNQTTGHVDIRWITESELNNAGFNILRAEGKDGEFKVINLQGIIAGHGTTSEKHVYTFTDKTAKPNVVYYYQIEDVSLNGNRTTLATTHMRGNVSAAGKVTTTWGDLKFQK